jgi:hypothetical protein
VAAVNRTLLVLVLGAIIIAAIGLVVTRPLFLADARDPAAKAAAAATPPLPTNNRPPAAKAGTPVASTEPRSDMADTLNSPTTDIRADLRTVLVIVDAFRSNFPRDGNPVGNNAEITAALTGRNQLRLALIPPDHPAINQGGELCDRWGTPFFFHTESATRMEVRSAGPDRKLWNEDDVILAP